MTYFLIFRQWLFCSGLLALALFMISCSSEDSEPGPGSEEYTQAVADFYMSLGASQTDQSRFAFNKMNEVAAAFPKEAAAWANLGVYAMRQGNLELAADRLQKARDLKPDNPDVLFLSSMVESRRGNINESIAMLREAAIATPENPRILFALAGELEREDDEANISEIESVLQQLHILLPDNRVVLLELIRLAAKQGDINSTEPYLNRLREISGEWSAENRAQLQTVLRRAEEENASELLLELSFLRSGLGSDPAFQDDLFAVQLPPTDVGYLITRFLHLPEPEVEVADPDLDMSLNRSEPELPEPQAQWLKGVTLLEDVPPFPVAISNGEIVVDNEVRLEFPGDPDSVLPASVFAEIDYNYNFRNDIAVAGSRGFRLYRQNSDQTFSEVIQNLELSPQTINGSYRGVWPFDADMDGDLDLLLARIEGEPLMLRNNGDNTFSEMEPFNGQESVLDFRWADLDDDGVPEAVFLGRTGTINVFRNLRGGRFDTFETVGENRSAIVIADLNADARFEIVSIDSEGVIRSGSFNQRNTNWEETELTESLQTELDPDKTIMFSADLDNNGALDLMVSTRNQSWLWLGNADRKPVLYEMDNPLPGGITSVFDVDGDDRLDLLGVGDGLEPYRLMNRGTKNYLARSIRARASGTEGDRRINSFGIGGEMEVRSGLLYQKQLIESPIVHFGLGEYEEAQMLRIIWPNGSVQAEFAELGMGATIFNEQILKGSCPWLFTGHEGEMHFITDILWRSPLGLRINALETAGVEQTLDRVKIPADKIKATDGFYDVRITAELWETHFFDYVSLVTVDHPVDTEIFLDERFGFPAPDLSTRLMGTPNPVLSVSDQWDNDVTETVSDMNEEYISPFKKTAYQGLTEEHFIEIVLNDRESPQWLLLSGWLRPTDSSINLALSQGSIHSPNGLHVEVSDGTGKWVTLHENHGFPAGKLKTILVDLENALPGSEVRKVKLTTTTEIYWDGIFQADKLDSSALTEITLEPETADLRYRGFSEWSRANATSPKLPDYSFISSTNQRWRDLEGFHTRFGDVKELLQNIDDRYVIMNAGDELVLRFRDSEPPKEGYKRSYLFVSDGWEKDGDYNTEASASVLPLPYHGQQKYSFTGEETLFNDPVFQKNPEDWIFYHTRYVTSQNFRNALVFD